MIKAKVSTLLLGSMIILSGCGAQDQIKNVQDMAETAQDKVEQVQGLLAHKDKLMGMKGDVTKTIDAVKAGDFAAAQEQFSTIKTGWEGIQSSLGDQADASVKSIQTDIEGIASDLGAESPDQEKILGSLDSLSTSLVGVVSGGESEAETTEAATTEEEMDQASATETEQSGEMAEKAQMFQDNLMAMKDSLKASSEALGSGDYGAVKETFGAARQTWFKFGGSVKAKSEEAYQTLDAGVKTLNTALSTAEPEPEAIKSGLDSLLTSLDQISE